MIMKRIINFSFIFFVVLLISCSKEQQEVIVDPIFDSQQREMLLKMKDVSTLIAQFAENEEIKMELDQMIKLKMYNDDYILFRDLFTPTSNDKLKSAKIESTAFERAFNNATNSSGFKSGEIDDLKNYLVSNNLVLYIPYPIEMFPEDKRIPTISYHPLINDSINEGFQAIIKNNIIEGINTVIVNDDYALENFCYIVVPAGRLGYESENYQMKSVENSTSANHYEIRIKKARCKVQFDGFFDGGSEVYFGCGTPAIANGHVTAEPLGFLFTFNRSEILWNTIKEVNTLFIADWAENKTQIVMFVYEKDPVGSVEVSGNVKITHTAALKDTTSSINVGSGWESSQSFKRVYQSEDCVIFNNEYPRDWFFGTNSDPTAEWGEFSSTDNVIVRGNQDMLDWTMTITQRFY
jgi:hypothetical protein